MPFGDSAVLDVSAPHTETTSVDQRPVEQRLQARMLSIGCVAHAYIRLFEPVPVATGRTRSRRAASCSPAQDNGGE